MTPDEGRMITQLIGLGRALNRRPLAASATAADNLPPWTGAETVACAWCGEQVSLAAFTAHTVKCEREARNGQRSLFGGARGLFDELEHDGRHEQEAEAEDRAAGR